MAPDEVVANAREVRMIDVARVTPPEQVQGGPSPRGGPAEFEPFNLKGKSRCRPAVGAAGRHQMDNHKSQDPQAR
jgi:hypothetical protein